MLGFLRSLLDADDKPWRIMLINAGVKKIYFGEMYRDHRIFEYAEMLGVELVDLSHLSAKVDLSALEESLGDNADNEPKREG